jgi:hypothetical protein
MYKKLNLTTKRSLPGLPPPKYDIKMKQNENFTS